MWTLSKERLIHSFAFRNIATHSHKYIHTNSRVIQESDPVWGPGEVSLGK